MTVLSTRQANDLDRLTISVSGTSRGVMFMELGEELGRILPTTGDLLATEEFTLKANHLPNLLAEFLNVVLEGIKEGIVHTLWQCTSSYTVPGNVHKLYVVTHTEEIESLVEMSLIATKWFNTGKELSNIETLEVVCTLPSVLG